MHADTDPLTAFFMRTAAAAAALPLLATLAGCGSLTGLDAESSFSCGVPAGKPCQPLATAYSESLTLEVNKTREARAAQDASSSTSALQRANADLLEIATPERALEPRAARSATTPKDGPRSAETHTDFYTVDGERALTLPRRVPERVLTLFVAPWTDADGDLHEGEVVYVTVTRSHWAEGGRRAYFANRAPVRAVGELTRARPTQTRAKREAAAPELKTQAAPTPLEPPSAEALTDAQGRPILSGIGESAR